jgi:hypothetical protein
VGATVQVVLPNLEPEAAPASRSPGLLVDSAQGAPPRILLFFDVVERTAFWGALEMTTFIVMKTDMLSVVLMFAFKFEFFDVTHRAGF